MVTANSYKNSRFDYSISKLKNNCTISAKSLQDKRSNSATKKRGSTIITVKPGTSKNDYIMFKNKAKLGT